jgi:hypothetical protein
MSKQNKGGKPSEVHKMCMTEAGNLTSREIGSTFTLLDNTENLEENIQNRTLRQPCSENQSRRYRSSRNIASTLPLRSVQSMLRKRRNVE